jgi:hypothetical protein
MKHRLTWLLWASIVIQQLVLLDLYGREILLVHVSSWVSRVPIVIIWALYAIAPVLYARPFGGERILRCYALSGWLFVLAAFVWWQSYWGLSKKYGVPVSWSEIEKSDMRGDSERQWEKLQEGLQKKPNQLPDPTSPAVTPLAKAGSAPSVTADH